MLCTLDLLLHALWRLKRRSGLVSQPTLNRRPEQGVCLQSALNYEEMVSGRPAVVPPAQRNCVEDILLTERDAVLCRSLAEAAHAQRPSSKPWQRPLVVGAVGEAHLEGIADLWQDDRWREVVQDLDSGGELMLTSLIA